MNKKVNSIRWEETKMQILLVGILWTIISSMILLKSAMVGSLVHFGNFSIKDEIQAWLISLFFIPIAVVIIKRGIMKGHWIVSLFSILSIAIAISFIWNKLLTKEVIIPVTIEENANFPTAENSHWVSKESLFFQSDIFDMFSSFLFIIGIAFAVSIFQLLRLRELSELKLKTLLIQSNMNLLKAQIRSPHKIEPLNSIQSLAGDAEDETLLTHSNLKTNKISVKLGNRTYFILIDEIAYIVASGNYLEIFVDKKPHVIRETMNGLLNKLPPNFLRIHKSSIVNTEFIRELISIGYGDYELKMNDEKVLRISDSYKQNVLKVLQI